MGLLLENLKFPDPLSIGKPRHALVPLPRYLKRFFSDAGEHPLQA
ncbi:MAG: hypothetical protein ACK5RA_02295 [Cyanobacteriota bacterium]